VKILHVETGRHLYGGPQQVLYLARGLIGRGYECTIVCPPGSGIDTAARLAAIPVRNLFCAGDLDLPFAYRLTQYLQAERPDIVHCHSRRGADVLGGLAASFADVPAVVSRRVDNTEMRLTAAVRYRPFARIVAISETIARVLEDNGFEPGRIVVIRSAVDTAYFAASAGRAAFCGEFGIPEDACVIAAAGQLIERKGHRFLLEAVAQIKAAQPRIRLIVFGEGPLDTELRAQAAALGLGDVAQFPGFRDDLDDFMGAFDIFAHPALAEGLGVVTLKAAAAGLPVVGFAAGGVPEAVIDGKTGLLVTPGSADELAAALASLVADPARRRAMGAAGRERMRAEFSIDTMVEQHIALYDSILNG
jgi:glycosyltransferase involved in cell wall biosynthesis